MYIYANYDDAMDKYVICRTVCHKIDVQGCAGDESGVKSSNCIHVLCRFVFKSARIHLYQSGLRSTSDRAPEVDVLRKLDFRLY